MGDSVNRPSLQCYVVLGSALASVVPGVLYHVDHHGSRLALPVTALGDSCNCALLLWFTGRLDVETRGAELLWPGFPVVIADYSNIGGVQPGSRPLGLLQD